MSFAFNNREDHALWSSCYTLLPLKVGRIITDKEVELSQSNDPKMKELHGLLNRLQREFSHNLHKGMDRIEFEWSK